MCIGLIKQVLHTSGLFAEAGQYCVHGGFRPEVVMWWIPVLHMF